MDCSSSLKLSKVASGPTDGSLGNLRPEKVTYVEQERQGKIWLVPWARGVVLIARERNR